ncbi:claudin-4-like [Hoplias malabaricus]|uniref:claudin-4-like n=1 Tax=Hoplias malabaricus TaxID=27720 RepID=UPI0034620834
MASQGVQMLGAIAAIMGWLGAMITCGLPQWRVTAFIGSNIVTAQFVWEGIWMTCVVQSTGQMQCKIYDSVLALGSDLQAARAMIILCILFGTCGLFAAIAGGKCTNCIRDPHSKAWACISAGILFIIAGLMCLIPVSWAANTIISDFYNPLIVESQRRELGTSLYIGWASAGLLLMGGGLLCWNCPPKEKLQIYNPKFSLVRSTTTTSREYV